MRNIWVFDLDGTLIFISHDYMRARMKAVVQIGDKLGEKCPFLTKVMDRSLEISKERRDVVNPKTEKSYGYSMERFPTSLVATYREVCDKAGVEIDPEFEKRLLNIGLEAFDAERYARNIKEGVEETLKFLKSRGETLVLLTKGDGRVQRLKIEALNEAGLGQQVFDEMILVADIERRGDRAVFDRVFTTTKKVPEVFRQVSESHESNRRISVGNNYHSDIEPALEIGFTHGIYIPEFTWEEEHPEEMDERCIELDNIREIPHI